MLAYNLVRDVGQHAFDLAEHTSDIAKLGIDSVALLSSALLSPLLLLLCLLLLLVLLVVTPHLPDILTVQVATDQLQSISDYSLDTVGE